MKRFQHVPFLMMAKKDEGKHNYLQDPNWSSEWKIDGVRAVLIKHGSNIHIYGRSKIDYTQKFPDIVAEAGRIRQDCILDGEITYLDSKGDDHFKEVSQRMRIKDPTAREDYIKKWPVKYVVFDCLSINGQNITSRQLIERQIKVTAILKSIPNRKFITQSIPATGTQRKKANLQLQRKLHHEGVMYKNIHSPYKIGRERFVRSSDWRKHKFMKTDEAIIIGYDIGEGKRRRLIGALYTAQLRHEKPFYTGKIGTGLADKENKELLSILRRNKAFKKMYLPGMKGSISIPEFNRMQATNPNIVIEIKYQERSPTNKFRHGVYMRLRSDKKPQECTL